MNSTTRFPTRRLSTRRRLFIERLEPRLALSTLHGADPLFILGTDGPDDIDLTYDSSAEEIRVSNFDQLAGTFSLHELSIVQIDAGGGDDRIQVDPDLPLPVNVIGGDGSDTLIGARLQSDERVLFTSGERLVFNNLSCVTVECVRTAEGEATPSANNNQTPTSSVLPPGLGMVDHSHDMPTLAMVMVGDFAARSVASPSAVAPHGHEELQRVLLASNEAHSKSGHSSLIDIPFDRMGHNPIRSTPDGSDEAAGSDHRMQRESEFAAPAIPSLEIPADSNDKIDAILEGWTEGAESASSENSDSAANLPATRAAISPADFAAPQLAIGVPDVAPTVADRQESNAGTRTWSIVGAITLALVSGIAGYLLDRRFSRQNMIDGCD